MRRYAAKLLFDWNRDPVTGSRVMRLFEERIVVFDIRSARAFDAHSARAAVAAARRLGSRSELRYKSGHRLRFVGRVQLMELGAECGEGEVWWELRRRRMTLARARALLPADKALYVFDGPMSAAPPRRKSLPTARAASRPRNRSRRRTRSSERHR